MLNIHFRNQRTTARRTLQKSKDYSTATLSGKSTYWTDLFGSLETTAKGFTVVPMWPPKFAKFVGGCGLYMVRANLDVKLVGDLERLLYMPKFIPMNTAERNRWYERAIRKDPTNMLKADFVSNTQVFLLCAKATLAYCHVLDPPLLA